jgi:hypothetical protein
MARAANAQQLNIDPARGANRLFVLPAVVVHLVLRQRAVGDMHVLAVDVDVVEKVLPPPTGVLPVASPSTHFFRSAPRARMSAAISAATVLLASPA